MRKLSKTWPNLDTLKCAKDNFKLFFTVNVMKNCIHLGNIVI